MNIWIVAALAVIIVMAAYAAYLWLQVRRQSQARQQAWLARRSKIAESIDIIAMAVEQGQCNLSEGVLRLKPLAEAAGLDFSVYPAMNALYKVVADMPILEARQQLKRNERMKLDLIRESSEAEHEQAVVAEAGQIRQAVKAWLPNS